MNPTPLQQDVLSLYPPPRLFAVVSWGCAGTSWLARVLNSHPDVYCVHAAATLWRIFADAPYADGPAYMRLLGAQGYAHRVAGDVHGVSRAEIPAIRREFGDSFHAAVLVRDPLPRLRSQLALMARLGRHQNWDLSYVAAKASELGLDPARWSYEDNLRFHAVNMLNSITEEVAAGPVYRIEDLGASDAILLELFSHLTDGLAVPAWWLAYVRTLKHVNSHANKVIDSSRLAVEPEFLRRVVQPESWDQYRQLGYACI